MNESCADDPSMNEVTLLQTQVNKFVLQLAQQNAAASDRVLAQARRHSQHVEAHAQSEAGWHWHRMNLDSLYSLAGLPTTTAMPGIGMLTPSVWPEDYCLNFDVTFPAEQNDHEQGYQGALAMLGGVHGSDEGNLYVGVIHTDFLLRGNGMGFLAHIQGDQRGPFFGTMGVGAPGSRHTASFCYKGSVNEAAWIIDGARQGDYKDNRGVPFPSGRSGSVSLLSTHLGAEEKDRMTGATLHSFTISKIMDHIEEKAVYKLTENMICRYNFNPLDPNDQNTDDFNACKEACESTPGCSEFSTGGGEGCRYAKDEKGCCLRVPDAEIDEYCIPGQGFNVEASCPAGSCKFYEKKVIAEGYVYEHSDGICNLGHTISSQSGRISDLQACATRCTRTNNCAFMSFCPRGVQGCEDHMANFCMLFAGCETQIASAGFTTYRNQGYITGMMCQYNYQLLTGTVNLNRCRRACRNQPGCSEFSLTNGTECRYARSAAGCCSGVAGADLPLYCTIRAGWNTDNCQEDWCKMYKMEATPWGYKSEAGRICHYNYLHLDVDDPAQCLDACEQQTGCTQFSHSEHGCRYAKDSNGCCERLTGLSTANRQNCQDWGGWNAVHCPDRSCFMYTKESNCNFFQDTNGWPFWSVLAIPASTFSLDFKLAILITTGSPVCRGARKGIFGGGCGAFALWFHSDGLRQERQCGPDNNAAFMPCDTFAPATTYWITLERRGDVGLLRAYHATSQDLMGSMISNVDYIMEAEYPGGITTLGAGRSEGAEAFHGKVHCFRDTFPRQACWINKEALEDEQGQDIVHWESGKSRQDCQKECFVRSNCKSFTHNHETRSCWLKEKMVTKSTPATVPAEASRTYYQGDCEAKFCWINKEALENDQGPGIAGWGSGYTLDDCKQQCDMRSTCNSITYRKFNDAKIGACYLKEKQVSVSSAATSSGTRQTHYRGDCIGVVQAKPPRFYILMSARNTVCPEGWEISNIKECQYAYDAIQSVYSMTNTRGMQTDSWNGVPRDCSVQYSNSGNDKAPHWNTNTGTDASRATSGEFRVICGYSKVDRGAPRDINCDQNSEHLIQQPDGPIRMDVRCPANCPSTGTIWGDGLYTSDSKVCAACIHNEAIRAFRGGVCTIINHKGLNSYRGTHKHGFNTRSYGSWARAFGTGGPGEHFQVEIRSIGCGDNSESLIQGGDRPSQLDVLCGANCGGEPWGTGIFTSDSPVCAACIHSGVFPKYRGGMCTITKISGQGQYAGTSRNGIQTRDYGNYARSFFAGPSFVGQEDMKCPPGSLHMYMGTLHNDISGCGLQGCGERYGLATSADCRDRCASNPRCKAFSWAPINGDQNHMTQTTCTIYNADRPTATWGPRSIFCKMTRDWVQVATQGWCSSGFLGQRIAVSLADCKRFCLTYTDCAFVSYKVRANRECMVYSNCNPSNMAGGSSADYGMYDTYQRQAVQHTPEDNLDEAFAAIAADDGTHHCSEGAGGTCYSCNYNEAPCANWNTGHDAKFTNTYSGFQEFCKSWSSNGGNFNGGCGPCESNVPCEVWEKSCNLQFSQELGAYATSQEAIRQCQATPGCLGVSDHTPFPPCADNNCFKLGGGYQTTWNSNGCSYLNPAPEVTKTLQVSHDSGTLFGAIYKACIPYSQEACLSASADLGLKWGHPSSSFAGNYHTKGCYTYMSGTYENQVFYGTGGSVADMQTSLDPPQMRVPGADCIKPGQKYTLMGEHVTVCPTGLGIYSIDECTKAYASIQEEFSLANTRGMVGGMWSNIPVDCSVQYDNGNYDQAPHWNLLQNTDNARALTGEFRIVCRLAQAWPEPVTVEYPEAGTIVTYRAVPTKSFNSERLMTFQTASDCDVGRLQAACTKDPKCMNFQTKINGETSCYTSSATDEESFVDDADFDSYFKEVPQCIDAGSGHNFCSEWCAVDDFWSECGVQKHKTMTCDCTGCNGCGGEGFHCVTTTSGPGCARCVLNAARTKVDHCASCHAGYGLQAGHCQEYVCETGDACYTCVVATRRTRQQHCMVCNTGYTLVNHTCVIQSAEEAQQEGGAASGEGGSGSGSQTSEHLVEVDNVVDLILLITGVSWTKLREQPEVRARVTEVIQQDIANNAGAGTVASDIQVNYSGASLRVEAQIKPPNRALLKAVENAMDPVKATIAHAIADDIKKVNGIRDVTVARVEDIGTNEAEIQLHLANQACEEILAGPHGRDYHGCQTRTRSGLECQPWDKMEPHYHDDFYSWNHHYCRNPDAKAATIWCYTTDPNTRWEHCDPIGEARQYCNPICQDWVNDWWWKASDFVRHESCFFAATFGNFSYPPICGHCSEPLLAYCDFHAGAALSTTSITTTLPAVRGNVVSSLPVFNG